jgi:hypothetical protein
MAIQLNTDNYSIINDDMNSLLTSGAYAGINATIYNDAQQTSIVNDTNGPIQNRRITQITHVAGFTDSLGQTTNGSVSIVFSDGTSVTAVDGVNSYYYVLTGVIFQPRRF